MQSINGLTNVQQELLKICSCNLPEKDLKEMKTALAHFFADKAVKAADKEWEKQGLSNETMDEWLNKSK